MVLDDGGDATHLLVKKYNSIFKLMKVSAVWNSWIFIYYVEWHHGIMNLDHVKKKK